MRRTKRLALTAMFAALCAVFGFIKIPSGVGSLALDAVPALISAAFLPPAFAGMAAAFGHLSSALYAGFPLGPLHIVIAIEMLLILYVFTRLHRSGRTVLMWVFFVIANGLLAPLPFYFLVSPAFFTGAVPAIFLSALLNALVAGISMQAVKKAAHGRKGLIQ